MNSMQYRKDIDGLRAIAVLAVLLFHLDPRYLNAGYLGVDVFFVISGYLITRIVYTELMEKRYTFTNFYVRRSKRILPPLYFMAILTMIAAYFILLPYDFFKTGISILGAILFVSNMQFALRTGDYFSSDSSEWPMLHTWSLSVEEQYYFILPIVLIIFIRFIKVNLTVVLIVLALASFALAQYMSGQSNFAGLSYYFLLTRMGELLVGSVLAIAHAKGSLERTDSSIVTTMAVVVLAATLLFFDKQFVFPGFSAMLACIPIALIIHSKDTWVNRALENGVVVWIGLLSYSLYLFHWPVLALARYILNTTEGYLHLPLTVQLICLALIFGLSLLSYYAVERPLRRLNVTGIKALIWYFAIPSAALVLLAAGVVVTKGLPNRLTTDTVDTMLQYSHIDRAVCPSLVNLGCDGGDIDSDKEVVLLGNSHSEHYFELFSRLAEDAGMHLKMWGTGGCGLKTESSKCDGLRKSYTEKLQQEPELTIIAFRWDLDYQDALYLSRLDDLVNLAVEKSKRVVVMAQPPLLTFSPAKIANCDRLGVHCLTPEQHVSELYPVYNDTIEARVNALGAEFFDPYKNIEDVTQLYDDDRILYSDMDHLSVYGGRWLHQQMAERGAELLQR